MIYEWKQSSRGYHRLYAREDDELEGWPVAIVAPVGDDTWSYDCAPGITAECPYTLNCAPVDFGKNKYTMENNALVLCEQFVEAHLIRKEKFNEHQRREMGTNTIS